ncbi:alpha/beta fold hydrolase [candidate division GN15 bacterium]|nr:alpha/beta fold hydrolase [candidate division GN15 bacterium]
MGGKMERSGQGHSRGQRLVLCLAAAALLWVAVMVACGQSDQQAVVDSAEPRTDSVVSADGVMIHYTAAGPGDSALVFVHGWSCDRTYFQDQLEAFDDLYRVVAVDLAGHGQSGTNRTDWTIEAFGADVVAVMNELDIEPVILVGHSMGGAVVVEAARQAPGRVEALIGIDTYQDLTQTWDDDQARQFVAPFTQDFPAATRLFVQQMFRGNADTALVHRVSEDMASAPKDVAIASFKALAAYDPAAALAEMRKPIRSINADMYPTNIEANQQAAASYEVTFMPGQGHFPHLEAPETFNRILRETISEFWPIDSAVADGP